MALSNTEISVSNSLETKKKTKLELKLKTNCKFRRLYYHLENEEAIFLFPIIMYVYTDFRTLKDLVTL